MKSVRTWALTLMAVVVFLTSGYASAQSEDKNAQKAARRAQLQMQSLRQQVQEAQAAKAKVEADKAELDAQLAAQTQQAGRLDDALRKASGNLRASEVARNQMASSIAALERQLAEQKQRSDDALAQKARELEQYTRLRNEQQLQLQRQHDDQVAQVAACTAKNGRLIQLSAELLDRYRNKGLGEVLRQRDPVLGLADVELFNLVQDHRDRTDAERFVPSSPSAGAPTSVQAVPGRP
ncbi:MAG: hypothetical protein CFE40_02450 [Burkholderiales bacterium PBB1]|nr:MAG: hypothetical protein CFE40_02450 [Burkholderiales bacterium PBB1]